MALDKFQPYLFVSAGEQSNKYLTPVISPGGIASFQAQRAQDLAGLTIRIDPVQSGSGDPSPDNIRPISGRTGMTVTRAGKNLLVPWMTAQTIGGITYTPKADGTFTTSGTATANSQIVSGAFALPHGSYILTGMPTTGSGTTIYFRALLYQSNGTSLVRVLANDYGNGGTFTISEDEENIGCVVKAFSAIQNGQTAPSGEWKPMIRPATITDDTYEPYTAQTIPITWESIAGTVYVGTLDVVSGVLTVDKGYAVYDGSEDESWNWRDGGTYKRVAIPLSDVYNPGGRVSVQSNAGVFKSSGNEVGTIFASGTTLFYYPSASITTFADYKTWLASNNLQVVYPLATPQTYQLTPTEVRTILGYNQIYSDAGPVIDIKF